MRWLSQGSALQRFFFFSLQEEIQLFLTQKGQPMQELADTVWLAELAFLVDTTKHLNVLYVSQLYAHVKTFGTKPQLFHRHPSQTEPSSTHFPALCEVMDSFPQDNIGAQRRRYTTAIASPTVESSLPPSLTILMMLHISCSGSSLSCSVTLGDEAVTSSFLL